MKKPPELVHPQRGSQRTGWEALPPAKTMARAQQAEQANPIERPVTRHAGLPDPVNAVEASLGALDQGNAAGVTALHRRGG